MQKEGAMSACVRSGWCCKQGVCPYGKWDKEKKQCKFLIKIKEDYACSKYEEIIKDPLSEFSPAFGAGCSSSLNPDRLEKIKIISKKEKERI